MTETIGRYEIRAELGRGGMATVYRGYDPRFGREVAVKVLPASFLHDPSFRSRFEREARTIAGLEHPAIVPVYDVGEHEGQPYLVMRLMTGSLEDRLQKGPLSLQEAATLFARLAGALDRAHTQGIVHRDLKPGNILFDSYGAPYISDFGIVKLNEASEKLSMSGSVMGTPSYMSPEQAHGDRELDGRSDVYTLGVILFEVLTGTTPYQADTPIKMMMKHVMEPVPQILAVNPNLPAGAESIIARAMAKEPRERYATAGEMAAALTALAEGQSEATLVPGTVVASTATRPALETATEVLPATPATPLPATPRPAPPGTPGEGGRAQPEQPVSTGQRTMLFGIGGGLAALAVVLMCALFGLGALIERGVFVPAPTRPGGVGVNATATSGNIPPSPPVIAVAGGEATEGPADPPLAAPGGGGAPPATAEPSLPTSEPADTAAEPPPPTSEPDTAAGEEEPELEPGEELVDITDITPIEQVSGIETYHMSLTMLGGGEAFEQEEDFFKGQLVVEAEVIQEPLGYTLQIQNIVSSELHSLDVILTEGRAFVNEGERWDPIPPEEALKPQDMLFFDIEDLAELAVDDLQFIGIEEVQHRTTVHYQGTQEALAPLTVDGDPADIASGQIDIWLDQEFDFLVKMDLNIEGTGINANFPEAAGFMGMQLELSAFNVGLRIPLPPLGPPPPPP